MRYDSGREEYAEMYAVRQWRKEESMLFWELELHVSIYGNEGMTQVANLVYQFRGNLMRLAARAKFRYGQCEIAVACVARVL